MTIPIYIYSILISLIIGGLRYKKINPPFLLLTIPYLFISLIVEIYGQILSQNNKHNVWLFNLYTPIEFIYFTFLYYRGFQKILYKQITFYFIPAYSFCTIINQIFYQGGNIFHSVTFMIGSFFTIVFSIFYLIELFSPNSKVPIKSNLLFWITLGILFFYLSNFTYLGLYNYLVRERIEVAKLFQKALRYSNLVMFVFYAIGFICLKTRK